MSTFDYPSLARNVPLSVTSGLMASTGREPNPTQQPAVGPLGGAPSLGSLPTGSLPTLPPADASPVGPSRANASLDAPLSEVAKLHTAAERSMLPAAAMPLPANAAVPADAAVKSKQREMHRVREVRREQGISIKRASQHLGVSVEEARRQEDPTTDLTMTQLLAWQKLCEVPVADLLVEPDCELSAPVLQRARMVRVMKTVQAILERTGQQSVKRLGQTLVNQLIEMMPELKGVSSWHAVERRKSCNQNARILESNYLRPTEDDPRE